MGLDMSGVQLSTPQRKKLDNHHIGLGIVGEDVAGIHMLLLHGEMDCC